MTEHTVMPAAPTPRTTAPTAAEVDAALRTIYPDALLVSKKTRSAVCRALHELLVLRAALPEPSCCRQTPCVHPGIGPCDKPAVRMHKLEVPVDPLQGAANWLAEAHERFSPSILQSYLLIGHNRASRLYAGATRSATPGGDA